MAERSSSRGARVAAVNAARDTLAANSVVPWHRHAEAYVAVVVHGEIAEVSEAGRRMLHAGDVVFHAPYEAHFDRTHESGAVILNLPFDGVPVPSGRIGDVGRVLRLAGFAHAEALACLRADIQPVCGDMNDWPDRLADAICADPSLSIGAWAADAGLRSETVSRGFRSAYGLSPKAFRSVVRARAAWRRIVGGREALSGLAASLGFSDQAHMSREVAAMTGHPPSAWRSRAAPVN